MNNIAICPTFSKEEALFLLKKEWGIYGVLKPLDSYLDQNFLVQSENGEKFVLKIANIETPEDWLDLQNKSLIHLESDFIPKIVLSNSGKQMLFHESHWWRVLEFLEGTMLSSVPFRSNGLLKNIGEFAGGISKQLSTFNHPAAERPIQWDLQHAESLLNKWIDFVDDKNTKNSILTILENWETKKESIAKLRKSVIHADLTRYNILLDDTGEKVQGVIDFGDICLSWTIGELAVLVLESVMTGSINPFQDAYEVIQSYHQIFPLEENEIELLYSMMQLRSAMIVCASSRQLSMEPDNDYVRKQYIVDQKMFQQLSFDKNNFATALFLDACMMKSGNTILLRNQNCKPLFNETYDFHEIDFSPTSEIYNDGAWNSPADCKQNIKNLLNNGFGYTTYLTPIIKPFVPNGKESETIALGVFAFAPAGTAVYAPSDLVFVNKINEKSTFKAGDIYLYLYGINHDFKEGVIIKNESLLGIIAQEKADYPSHLFIQIDSSGNAPAFCVPSESKGWQLLVEDALFLLGLSTKKDISNSEDTLENRRAKVIQQAQEYYYRKPMNLVRGWKQYLIDDNGQVYLDAINNVAHIGHCHPKITEAATYQLKRLNTNARFLYEENIDYAENLLKHFPKSLQILFFTCTGSEANDLALRLARAYTNQKDVIVIDGEYHGNTTAVDEISTCIMDNPTASKSIRPFTHPLMQPNTFRGKYRDDMPNVAELYAKDADEKIDYIHSQGRGVAAFISESLLGSGGGVEMPKDYLKKVYQSVHNAGGVCIADEVQIGFGRMGSHFWGFEKEGVLPDIVTLGKPMGNGHPISAVITSAKIADAYKEKYTYFNTFAGNSVSCQIANTVLNVIEEEKLQENANTVGAFLKKELEKLVSEFEFVGAIYGHSFYLGVDLVEDKTSRNPDSQKALWVCEAMKQRGIIVYPTGDFYNILKIKPPMCFTIEDATFFVENLRVIFSTIEN